MQTGLSADEEHQRYSAWRRHIAGLERQAPWERFGSRLKRSIGSGGEMREQLDAVFDRSGPLAARIPEYRVRSQQLEMANRVAGAIRDNAVQIGRASCRGRV